MSSNRVIYSGRLYSSEEWSCGISYASPTGMILETYEGLLAWATNVGTMYQGILLPPSLRALLSVSGTLNLIRTEARSSTGKLIQAAEWTPPAPIVGTGSPTKPFQSALVIGMRTGRPGRSYRGRMFWPALGAATDSGTGRLDLPSATTVASEVATMVSAIGQRASATSPLIPHVESRTLGIATRVTSIDVGDVLDVMRRRRDNLVESRVQAGIPTL